MSNFVHYKDCVPVNLDFIERILLNPETDRQSVRLGDCSMTICIKFVYNDDSVTTWKGNKDEEMRAVYNQLLKMFSNEIKIDLATEIKIDLATYTRKYTDIEKGSL
jgi:hypothetical protein